MEQLAPLWERANPAVGSTSRADEAGNAKPRPGRNWSALFDEDFDKPTRAPQPKVVEPVYSSDDITGAREAAWQEGHAAGLQEAEADTCAVTQKLIETIAGQLETARATATEIAEQSAEELARLLLDSLAAILPTLCAQHGEAEVQAVVRAVLPALTQEPAITIRANPHERMVIAQEMERLEPELAARVQIVPTDAIAPGDVRITWRNGAATRNAEALWQQVAAILAPIREGEDGQ
jgi:flagellar biosynthesis/type III secretory pathway protein FliH